MKQEEFKSRWMLIASMCIFGTIGILRKFIPLSSGLLALVRAVVGAVFLTIVVLLRRQRIQMDAIRNNLIPLLLSGIALGFNWILLFESYNHTSVATATLCYYLAPILVILISPLVLKERLTARKLLCTAVSLCGMVLVSGILETGFSGLSEMKGILFGLGAAVLYATVILLNKRLAGIDAYGKTIFQLAAASAALLPYVLLTQDLSAIELGLPVAALLLVAGVVHTGVAYWLYFGSMEHLKAQTAAIFSYIDPVLAIILSILILREPMNVPALIGAAMILGAAFASER